MGLTYHFAFQASPKTTVRVLTAFLREVETEAKKMGFGPTMVLSAPFDTIERRQFARRLTTGLLVEDRRLIGANLPDDNRVWHHDAVLGACRVPPSRGVVLVVTDERGCEVVFGFFRYAKLVTDSKGNVVAETGIGMNWRFRNFVDSPDRRYRDIVQLFRKRGFVEYEKDEYTGDESRGTPHG